MQKLWLAYCGHYQRFKAKLDITADMRKVRISPSQLCSFYRWHDIRKLLFPSALGLDSAQECGEQREGASDFPAPMPFPHAEMAGGSICCTVKNKETQLSQGNPDPSHVRGNVLFGPPLLPRIAPVFIGNLVVTVLKECCLSDPAVSKWAGICVCCESK